MEVVFSESAAGCLSVAAHKRKFTDAISSAIIVGVAEENQSQNQEEIQKIVKESEQKERINWESMIPLEIERNDIFCFPLSLSFGDITEQEIGEQREKALKCLVNFYPDDVKPAALEMLSTAKKNLKELFCRAKKGESIRIWTSDTPDETSGFYWLINQLKAKMKMYASCPICGYKLCKGESGSDVDILCPRCGKLVRVVITETNTNCTPANAPK